MDFIEGEFVILNTTDSPATYGRKGTVVKVESQEKITVSVDMQEQGIRQYTLSASQLIRRKRERAFDKFLENLVKTTVIDSLDTAVDDYADTVAQEEKIDKESKQQRIVDQANSHIKIHAIGYDQGYKQGYSQGWNDALVQVNDIMKKHGYK